MKHFKIDKNLKGVALVEELGKVLHKYTGAELDYIARAENLLLMLENAMPKIYERMQKGEFNPDDLRYFNTLLWHYANLYKVRHGIKKWNIEAKGSFNDLRRLMFEKQKHEEESQ